MFGLTFPATVTRVIDGDTVEVEIRRTIRVRLIDCWAPETRTTDLVEKARGIKSKINLKKEAQGQNVSVSVPIDAEGKFGDSMSFGRVLGRIIRNSDGVDLSALQVEAGYATKERDS